MALAEFLLVVILGVCLAVAIHWGLGEHDARLALQAQVAASSSLQPAGTAAADSAQANCSREVAAAVRVGRSISRLAAPVAPVAGQPRPMLNSQDLASVAAQ